jgi:hypothetical protein
MLFSIINNSSSSSSRADEGVHPEAAAALLQANEASRQLSALWATNRQQKVLKQPLPETLPASGSLHVSVKTTTRLLLQLSSAVQDVLAAAAELHVASNQSEQLQHAIFTRDSLPLLLSSLLGWLQQQPRSLALHPHDEAAAAAGELVGCCGMWRACLQCVQALASLLTAFSAYGLAAGGSCMAQLTQALDAAGAHCMGRDAG